MIFRWLLRRARAWSWPPLLLAAWAACRGADGTEITAERWQGEVAPAGVPVAGEGIVEPDARIVLGTDAGAPAIAPAIIADAGLDPAPVADAGVKGSDSKEPEPPPPPPHLCSRFDPEPTLAALWVNYSVDTYLIVQAESCETAGLLPGASEDVVNEWFAYLVSYTLLLLGCESDAPPPAGGLEVFALANTGVPGVEVAPPALGQDDAEHLLRLYLDSLELEGLTLSAEERAVFEAFLRWQAAKVVDPQVSGALSTCAP